MPHPDSCPNPTTEPTPEELEKTKRLAEYTKNLANEITQKSPSPLPYKPFELECGWFRTEIGRLGSQVRALKDHPQLFPAPEGQKDPIDRAEAKANLILAFRHL